MNVYVNSHARRAVSRFGVKKARILRHEVGILWRDGGPKEILRNGDHWYFDLRRRVVLDVHDRRRPMLPREGLDLLAKSGLLAGDAEIMDLDDNHRALVWFDKRFAGVLGPGLHAWWKDMAEVRVEVIDIRENEGTFVHVEKQVILADAGAQQHFAVFTVPAEAKGALYRDGAFLRLLPAGRHVFWQGLGEFFCKIVDTRENALDISGQDMLTADKLAIRLNAYLSYRIEDVEKNLIRSADARQALYRETQLLLRAQVGARDLDGLMADKNALAEEMEKVVRDKAAIYGIEIISFGVRDIILPGDIKDLLIKTTEARKAAEAATILRREETAAMRHQLNTAKLLADNPSLMRLRELETLEKVANGSKLKVILGDKGLAEKVTSLI